MNKRQLKKKVQKWFRQERVINSFLPFFVALNINNIDLANIPIQLLVPDYVCKYCCYQSNKKRFNIEICKDNIQKILQSQ